MRNQRWLILISILQVFGILLATPESSEGWFTIGQLILIAVWLICLTALMNLGHHNGKGTK